MNIKNYASKPTLIEIVLDDPELIERYGEPITFYTYNIVRLGTYFDFFNARSNSEFAQLDRMMKSMILNENGESALKDDEDLPIDIAAAAINKLGLILGKQLSKTSIQTVGNQQK